MRNLTNTKRLLIAIVLNVVIVILQLFFGIVSHSIALITDAVHNFQDVLSLIIAFVAVLWSNKKPTKKMTYGYLRAEALAGFINSGFLVGAIFLVILTSIERLITPEEVKSIYVIIFGFIAFFINSFSAVILGFHHHHHHHHDLNITAAYLHLISDAGISLAVALGGIAMYYTGIYWIDPVLSLLFSLYILKETLPILKKSYNILMEGVPPDIDIELLKTEIKKVPSIKDIHDIHVWALSSKDIYFTGHIILNPDTKLEEIEQIILDISKILKSKGIKHITIQPETENFRCENVH
ncbi:MAG: cation transporter [Aquificae bacterium]|nr:cation transporter [Aquificota bacterium]